MIILQTQDKTSAPPMWKRCLMWFSTDSRSLSSSPAAMWHFVCSTAVSASEGLSRLVITAVFCTNQGARLEFPPLMSLLFFSSHISTGLVGFTSTTRLYKEFDSGRIHLQWVTLDTGFLEANFKCFELWPAAYSAATANPVRLILQVIIKTIMKIMLKKSHRPASFFFFFGQQLFF